MSNYGADEKPSIPAAQDLAFVKNFLPQGKPLVEQWTYPDDVTVRKLASKIDKSNVLFKFAPPPPPPIIPPPLDPVPAGDACTLCWGNGKAFGVGETPESITVVIQNVEKGPTWIAGDGEPPNGTFELLQNESLPCRFEFEDDDFRMFLTYVPPFAGFSAAAKNPLLQAFLDTIPPCGTFFTNEVAAKFINGTATIFIPPIA